MGTHTQEPGLAYQAVKTIADNHTYKTALDKGIRHIAEYDKKKKEEAGVEGKVNALKLFNYINEHVARPLLKGRNFDSQDAGFLAKWVQFKGLVERYGSNLDALLPRIAALYAQTSTQYIGNKDVEFAGTLPLETSKPGVGTLADISGQKYQLERAINDAKEPTDIQAVKGEIEPNLVRAVEDAADAGNLEKIIKAAKGSSTQN